ncbi:type IV toxin-antitoxin system AbiEi family antitoxin [Xylanimonas allomyrinae]|uniref:type IV toxin-antitoxin system AbiEi family antitoxin n=1 Tax=Xylanimonas allomyrinae TaxID=2509459 RepID=UPI0013A67DB5|nr:type IV toxin-antitoxin system AbiEi family antitoxin [Xylanimonas allomyrinae]
MTAAQIAEIATRHGIRTEPRLIAHRLREAGWLLPTGTRGVWEFAPGAHAGPFGHGDPTTPLRAALDRDPSLDAALCLHTAAWAHSLADRVPAKLDIAVPIGSRLPAGLARQTTAVRFDARLPRTRLKGVPVHAVESIVVHLAAAPSVVRWASVGEWFGELAALADGSNLQAEVDGRPEAVQRRVGYLLSGSRPDLAEPFVPARSAGKVWFGPRARTIRNSAPWLIADTILPFDPTMLPG